MKKYLIYSVILVVGIVLGWLFFGQSSTTETVHQHDKVSETKQLWTCSMHPQILQPEPGDCPICGMELIPADSGADGLHPNQFKLTEDAMALANIQTTVVGDNATDANVITLSGKIAENETSNQVQVTYFSGRIEHLKVNYTGETVRKGQLLATVYSPELYAAQQELITAARLKASQPELYNAVRNKLKLWKLSEQQINQIESSGKVKENVPVYATVSGVVTEKLVEQGDYVAKGQPLFKIANLNTVWANFDVYENQLGAFKKGQAVSITTNAYPGKTFKGTVAFIEPVLNAQTRTVTLRVVLSNTDGLFKPGMFVKGKIKTQTSPTSKPLSIPASAVLWTGERSVVYVKTNPSAPVFEMKEVSLGNKMGDTYQVLDGLNAGDEVVANGTFTVDAAAQLQGKKSMMNQIKDQLSSNHQHQKDKPKLAFDSALETAFQPVIDAYIDLKDALVKSDVVLGAQKSEAFRKALGTIPVGDREKTGTFWDIMNKASKGINTDVNIGQQRKQFQAISDVMIEMLTNFKHVDDTLFVQFCPMADHNKGAFWLSKDKNIINPYFGDAMLTCGEVKQVIK